MAEPAGQEEVAMQMTEREFSIARHPLAYAAGAAAGLSGASIDDSLEPYGVGTWIWQAWYEGCNDGRMQHFFGLLHGQPRTLLGRPLLRALVTKSAEVEGVWCG